MEIRANTTLSDILTKGTAEQKAVASYFDKDNNGIIDEKEASIFNSSKIKLSSSKVSITSANGQTQVFEDMAQAKSDEYYKSGTISVAVVDIFSGTGGGASGHGNTVANVLKENNSDLALTRIDVAKSTAMSEKQKAFCKVLADNPDLEEAIYTGQDVKKYIDENLSNNPDIQKMLAENPGLKEAIISGQNVKKYIEDKMLPGSQLTLKAYEDGFKEVTAQKDAGKNFKAINLSSSIDFSLEDLNSLCANKIGEKITPDNLARYKTQIRSILEEKTSSGELISFRDAKSGTSFDAKQVLSLIKTMENTKIPIYMAQAYKSANTNSQNFNLYSLADNALVVEAGSQNADGTTTSPIGSTNSLAIDTKTGQRRMASGLTYTGGRFSKNTTSFATPMVLAKSIDLNG